MGLVSQSRFHSAEAVGFLHILGVFLRHHTNRSASVGAVQINHAKCVTSTERQDLPLLQMSSEFRRVSVDVKLRRF